MRPSFLSLRKEKKQKKLKLSTEGREVFPGTSRIVEGTESLKLLASKYVPGQTWPASLTSWFSFASFLASRQEKALYRGRGSLAGYLENSWKSPKLAGVPDALIFFCFFSCIKARKEDHEAGKIFLMGPSFLALMQEKKQKKLKPSSDGEEVFPGASRIVEGPDSLKLLASKYVPGQTWLAPLTPWSSFAFFLASRQEKKIMRPEKSF